MEHVIDIFAKLPDGSPVWVECVKGLQYARARVKELKRIAPKDYFLYSDRNGIFRPEDSVEGVSRSEQRVLRWPRKKG